MDVPPVSSRAVYTAFGERVYQGGPGQGGPGQGGAGQGGTGVSPVGGRYGYAGAWGYQAAGGEECGPVGEEFLCDPLAELGWLHVGERYYDPACGRFVQRDPIGIRGGANVYGYVWNRPSGLVDPKGLSPDWHWENKFGHTPGFDPKNIPVGNPGPFETACIGAVGIAFGGPIIVMGAWGIGAAAPAAAAAAEPVIPYGLFRLYQQREQLINYLNSHGPDTPFWAGFVEELGQINNLINKYPR